MVVLSLLVLVLGVRSELSEDCVSFSSVSETRLLLTGLTCSLHPVQGRARGARQAFYGDTDVPVIKVDPDSSEGAKIAQQISALFREGGASSSPAGQAGFAAIKGVDMSVRSPVSKPGQAYTTPFQLNLNLNLDLEHGRPNKVRVPQGELTLMYIPQIRGPNGGASVEVNHDQLRELLTETDSPSSLVMLPSGGLLLMSLSPYTDTDPRYSHTLQYA